ncbi:transcriptional regulator [Halolactibacillus alkaliphilus]|uniref:Transcriptional regulator n=1 Tax=Halolactibacillus alkaliphilus TaxID=442899 RepID=A0A511X3M4_9BACI|nr:ROK family transcriptional regulator [Halolactibacillus alkaliphilus]GEN57544.1 transcriptional regulator [Halolactibacillus alkaliphilus]GGN73403.1 transcriptional regulator [Halolactibacillus alkaliphilus]SFO95988.1 Sugar kinase of the NBD/HSP70 family, may contain an N-terminal HTH domain [Halolactibacillus alkaliphilus]
MKRGSFQAMKKLNKSLILKKILNDGPISRAEIAKAIKLTPPTVGTIVKELIEQQIVKESAQGESKGGRKPTLLVIDHDAFCVIGIDAGPREVSVVLTNLQANLIDKKEVSVTKGIAKQDYLALLINEAEALINRNETYMDKLIGIGVAMHGVVDAKNGVGLFAPNLHLRDIPVKDVLTKHFDLVVQVENDARALALGETWFGQGKGINNLLAVNIGSGVGAGVVLDGKLYRGDAHIAGEIGHMTIDLHGETCSCGNKGCLQTIVSGEAIQKRAEQALIAGVETTLTTTSPTAYDLFKAAEAGDCFSQSCLTETAEAIGIGLTNVIHTINPDRILLNGGVMKASKYLLPEIKATVNRRALTKKAKETPIFVSELGDEATALGAVALVLVEVFKRNGEIHV